MIDWILFGIGMALGGSSGSSMAGDDGDAAAQSGAEAGTSAFQIEDQTPTGKFLTATEIKPIMDATRPSWVALREYNGQDWLYLTQIMSWRCGLHEVRYSVNGGPLVVMEMAPCHLETATPNAITSDDPLPYATFAPGSVQSVQVEVLYDDLTTDAETYQRKDVLMP